MKLELYLMIIFGLMLNGFVTAGKLVCTNKNKSDLHSTFINDYIKENLAIPTMNADKTCNKVFTAIKNNERVLGNANCSVPANMSNVKIPIIIQLKDEEVCPTFSMLCSCDFLNIFNEPMNQKFWTVATKTGESYYVLNEVRADHYSIANHLVPVPPEYY